MSEQTSAPTAADSARAEDRPVLRSAEGRLGRAWREIIRGLRGPRARDDLRETIDEIIKTQDLPREDVSQHERVLLTNLLKFRTLAAEDVSVPRADIIAVEAGISLEELTAIFVAQQHSRLPVYRETLDDVIGMIHVKDVLTCIANARPFDLRSILRRVLFVAPSMRILDLLLEMRRTRLHMALVVDEFGGVDGLVTIEDLVEEIVGEIEDEHDVDEGPKLVPASDGSLIADARTTIEEFEGRVGPILTDEEREQIDTLGGLVFAVAGRVPGRGELVTHASGLEFEVLDADPRRVKRVRVRNLPKPADSA
ncbi:MAG: HlyC/CorC family transporter [Alphaproteobacteria bacterium]|nr:HlyC/CorC family transporter [Alphaproteobacteria bacterium]